MPNTSSVYEIRWREVFPWLILVRAARAALLVRVLLLGMIGVVITEAGWSRLDEWFTSEQNRPAIFSITERPPSSLRSLPPLLARQPDQGNLFNQVDECRCAGPLVRGWAWASQPLTQLRRTDAISGWLKLGLAGVWGVAVWGLFGGAIARIAAIYLTRGEMIGPLAALRHSVCLWPSSAGAPTITFVGLAVMALPLAGAGMLLRFDLSAVMLAILWGPVLALGMGFAAAAIGLLVGWPLMMATAAVERSDPFDGVSRAYSYVYQRLLHLAFYLAVATALGIAAQWLVAMFVDVGVSSTAWLLSWGAGEERTAMLNGTSSDYGRLAVGDDSFAALTIQLWRRALLAVVTSFPMAYLWPAAVGIYLLLRQQIDETELDVCSIGEPNPAEGWQTAASEPSNDLPADKSEDVP